MSSILDTIIKNEGGYQNSPNDSGNYVGNRVIGTKYGITPETLARHRGVPKRTLNAADMMALDEQEARDIYSARYIDQFSGIKDKALRDNVIDMGVNAGPARAAKLLQEALGVKVDGHIGPNTLKRLRKTPISSNDYSDLRDNFYKAAATKGNNVEFLNGWLNRSDTFRN